MPLVLSKRGKSSSCCSPRSRTRSASSASWSTSRRVRLLRARRPRHHPHRGPHRRQGARGEGLVHRDRPLAPAVEINGASAPPSTSARRSPSSGTTRPSSSSRRTRSRRTPTATAPAQTVAIEADMMKNAEELGLVKRTVLPKATDAAGQAAHPQFQSTLPEGWVEVKGWGTPGEVTYAPGPSPRRCRRCAPSSRTTRSCAASEDRRPGWRALDAPGAVAHHQGLRPADAQPAVEPHQRHVRRPDARRPEGGDPPPDGRAPPGRQAHEPRACPSTRPWRSSGWRPVAVTPRSCATCARMTSSTPACTACSTGATPRATRSRVGSRSASPSASTSPAATCSSPGPCREHGHRGQQPHGTLHLGVRQDRQPRGCARVRGEVPLRLRRPDHVRVARDEERQRVLHLHAQEHRAADQAHG